MMSSFSRGLEHEIFLLADDSQYFVDQMLVILNAMVRDHSFALVH
ncbi:MAG: hypothetical protein V7K48_34525 [Nostoc sp.]